MHTYYPQREIWFEHTQIKNTQWPLNVSGNNSEPPAGCEVPSWPGPSLPPSLLSYSLPSMLRFREAVSHPPCLGGSYFLCKEDFSPLSELLCDPNDLPETTVCPGKSPILSQLSSRMALPAMGLSPPSTCLCPNIHHVSSNLFLSLSHQPDCDRPTVWDLCLYAQRVWQMGHPIHVYWCLLMQ